MKQIPVESFLLATFKDSFFAISLTSGLVKFPTGNKTFSNYSGDNWARK